MVAQFLANIINVVKERWFHVCEHKRLDLAYKRILKHQKQCQHCSTIKKDFLTNAHGLIEDDYNKLLEHYGAAFWAYYYENEHPTCILDHSLTEQASYRAYRDRKNIEDYILLPNISS